MGQWVMHGSATHAVSPYPTSLSDLPRSQKYGDLISTVTSDIDAVQDFISSVLLGMVVNTLTLVG